MSNVRKIIGDILFARVIDPETGGFLFEVKTDGRVIWIRPDRKNEAIQLFCKNFRVSDEDIIEALREGKLTLEQLDRITG